MDFVKAIHDFPNPDLTQIDGLSGTRPDGIPAGEKEKIFVLFEFVDNGQDQNQFQGDKLKVDWTFNAEQTAGAYYDDTDEIIIK